MAKKTREEKERVFKELEEPTYPESEEMKVGVNKNQLFVRIPKIVRERMNVEKGDKMKFTVYAKKGKNKVEIDVIKKGKANK